MQHYINIVHDNSSSLKVKSNALKKLKLFKTSLTEFCDSLQDVTASNVTASNVTEDNVDAVIDNLLLEIQTLNMDTLDDVQTLYNMKNTIQSCNRVLQTIKPTVFLCEDEMVDITDNIKSKFTIATTNNSGVKMIFWNKIDSSYETNTLCNVINPKFKHENNSAIFYPKVNFIGTNTLTVNADKTTNVSNNVDNNKFKMLVDSENFLIYLFLQWETNIFCLYYEESYLQVVCNKGIATKHNPDGIYIDNLATNKLIGILYLAIKNFK